MATHIVHRATCTEKFDDDNKVYTRYDIDGNETVDAEGNPTPRPYSQEEEHDAYFRKREEAENSLDTSLKTAVDEIVVIREQAEADVETAQQLHDQAREVANTLSTQATTISTWSPGTSYRRADLVAIRDEIRMLNERQAQIAHALSDFYAYRKANDIAVVKIYDAVLWLARRVAGRLID